MKTILIIDNCAITRECLSTILRAKGFRVQCASLISQAKSMLSKRVPDLIITEIRLPDDNSLNLMRTLGDDPRFEKSKIVLLTQAASKKPLMEAIELGVSKVMLKSKFTIPSYLETVNSVLSAPVSSPNTQSSTRTQASEVEQSYPLPENAIDHTLELKEYKPIISRSELKEGLNEMEDLMTLSEPVLHVLEAIDDPETSIEQVADLLKLEPAIAMKIMKIANSTEYSREENTSTLKDAVLRIGLEELKTLVTSLGILGNFQENENNKKFWDHTLAVAVCSTKISSLFDEVGAELAFTAGILHDIGRLIIEQAFNEQYEEILDINEDLGIALDLIEKRLLLADHAAIAQSLLHAWNLPKDLVDAIGNHHLSSSKIQAASPKHAQLATIIALSNRVVHSIGIGCSGNTTIDTTEEMIKALDHEELTIEWILDGLEDQVIEMQSGVFGGNDESKPKTELSCAQAPVFDHPFHPIYITMDPETDSIGNWVRLHADQMKSDQLPNIVILHARQPKDKQSIIDKLEEELKKYPFPQSSPALPLLILTPSGKTAIAEQHLRSHPCKLMMTPLSTLHFEIAVNSLMNGEIKAIEPRSTRRAA